MSENKYQNGKIYRITDVGYNMCYIGSTIERLSQRMSKHRDSYKLYLDNGFGKTTVFNLFDQYGLKNCKIELIESYPCSSRDELNAREGQHIRQNDCVNIRLEGRTAKEYAEQRKPKRKEYYNQNKEEFANKSKAYREQNKTKVAEKQKQYYENNKEQLNEIIECACGGCYSKVHKSRHDKTLKHQKHLARQLGHEINPI